MTEEIWDRVFCVKPKAAFNCIRHAIPHMLNQTYGRILNCTSRAWQGDPLKHAHYAAANAAVVGLTRGVSNEVFGRGVMVNAFSPWARTRASFELAAYAIVNNPGDEKVKAFQKAMFESTPAPGNLGPILAYLSSDLADGISGSVFTIGGNSIAMHREPDASYTLNKPGDMWTVEELKQQLPKSMFQNYRSRSADLAVY
jgi:3-oxoacyl-[acyl-carrier protein] reductase